VTVVFAVGATLFREADRRSDLPIYRNGPPGTFVIVERTRISLPTDSILDAVERDDTVVVDFDGFRFDGARQGELVFSRVRDRLPEEELSPDRSWTMKLDERWIALVSVDGNTVWTRA
jgi:hypothetical protein